MTISAIFREASGSLRGTLFKAGGFLGLDMIALEDNRKRLGRRGFSVPWGWWVGIQVQLAWRKSNLA
jgi:hypothetical protein